MAAFVDLLPEVLPDVPGCSEPLAERAIRNAVIRMCELAAVIKHTAPPKGLVEGHARYAVEIPQDYALADVLWVTVQGREIKGQSQDFLDLVWRDDRRRGVLFSHYHAHAAGGSASGWRELRQESPDVYFIERADGEDCLRLVGIPSVTRDSALVYQLSLKPRRSSSDVYDYVLEDHYRTIAKGALGELLRVPKKAWTDAARGAALDEEFEHECGDLHARSLRDFVRDDQANARTRAYP